MAKKFTKNAQKNLNKNPNVVKCTESQISFTEEFALKVCEALKAGEDPIKVFTDAGFSIKILGETRVNGIIAFWKSKYELEDLPRRVRPVKEKEYVPTAAERRAARTKEAVELCDHLIANPQPLNLPDDAPMHTVRLAAIKKTYEDSKNVVLKDLCDHYGYQYTEYYAYLQTLKEPDTFVNILNPHRKNK